MGHQQPIGKLCPATLSKGSDSMRINVATGSWVCMSCGDKGSGVLAHKIKANGNEFVDAAKANIVGIHCLHYKRVRTKSLQSSYSSH
jgi:hypothetical protein